MAKVTITIEDVTEAPPGTVQIEFLPDPPVCRCANCAARLTNAQRTGLAVLDYLHDTLKRTSTKFSYTEEKR